HDGPEPRRSPSSIDAAPGTALRPRRCRVPGRRHRLRRPRPRRRRLGRGDPATGGWPAVSLVGSGVERWPLQATAEAIPDPVAGIDVEDRVIAWNLAMATLFETPPTVALGNEFAALDVSYRQPQLRAALEDARRTPAPALLP